MSCTMQGKFCPSIRPRRPWPGGPGLGDLAWETWPGGPGLGDLAWGTWPGVPGLEDIAWKLYPGDLGAQDVRTDRQNIPCIIQDIVPVGTAAQKAPI